MKLLAVKNIRFNNMEEINKLLHVHVFRPNCNEVINMRINIIILNDNHYLASLDVRCLKRTVPPNVRASISSVPTA